MKRSMVKIGSIFCVLVLVAVAFSTTVTNVSACKGKEKEIEHLNPDAAVSSEGIVHIVWQDNLTGNYEIYYANNLTGAYKTELSAAVQKVQSLIANTTDKKLKSELEKVLKELNKALANATANDYQHSFKHLQHAVERLDKKDLNSREIITALANSARDVTKVNILYREFLNISQDHTTKAWEKFYKGLEKVNEEKYDKAVNEFRKAFKEAYKIDDDCEDEECSEKTNVGIDFGKIGRISYTDDDSTNPTVYLNGTIHVSWTEMIGNTTHIYYARSYNGISWWYFDVTIQASTYLLYWDIDLGSIDFTLIKDMRDFLRVILRTLERIWIWVRCHFFWGMLRDGTYAPISDPWLDKYPTYTTVYIDGRTIHVPGCEVPPPPPPDGNGDKAPDLTVTDISFSPSYSGYVFTTDTVTITATIKNQGDASATGITVRFWDNSVQIDSDKTIDYLGPYGAADATTTCEMSWSPSKSDHSIKVEVYHDGDGYTGNNELTEYTKALDPNADNDGDGLTNKDEIDGWYITVNGISQHVTSDPLMIDTDNDELRDGHEKEYTKTDPRNSDTDGDGISDTDELFTNIYYVDNVAYVTVPAKYTFTDREIFPCYEFSENIVYAGYYDICAGYRFATTAEGMPADTSSEIYYGYVPIELVVGVNYFGIDWENPDDPGVPWIYWRTDVEKKYLIDIIELTGDVKLTYIKLEYSLDPTNEDTDNDGLKDGDELTLGTYPLNPDTDYDDMSDGYEVNCGVSVGGWQDPLVHNERYAILISGGWLSSEDAATDNHVRYWNDLVDMYDIIVEHYNYDPVNVYVLYADGNTISTTNCKSTQPGGADDDGDGIPDGAMEVATHTTMVDGPATLAEVKSTFTTLASDITSNDFLYIMATDHGTQISDEEYICLWDHERISAPTFAGGSYVGKITSYSRMVIAMEQCNSGGFLDDLSFSKRVIYTACTENDLSSGSPNEDGATRDPFVYYFGKALIPISGDISSGTATYHPGADDNANGYISMKEAFTYSNDNDPYYDSSIGDSYSESFDYHQEEDISTLGGNTYL